MINANIVYAMVKRYMYTMRHDLNRLTDAFYEPAMQIFIWGFTSNYINNSSGNFPQFVLLILSGVVFWMIINHGQYAISVNLLQEFWDRNLINIFASPLRIREWIAAVMIVGVIKMSAAALFAVFLAWVFYKANLFIYGVLLIPFVLSLLLSGWIVGFIVSALIIRFGHTIQALAWIGLSILAPFSAIYYPVSILPKWMQHVSLFLPPTYIFEGMREIINKGSLLPEKLYISFALNIIYLILSIWFFVFMFNKSRKLGLGRLI